MARQSYDAEWRAGLDEKNDAKLLAYLYNNKHNTPFEHVTFTFNIMAPIFVFRQWHRHRTQSYSEVSARYTVIPNFMYVPDPVLIGMQSAGNKQCRDISEVELTREEMDRATDISTRIEFSNKSAYEDYELLLEKECPRELARGVLPFNMYSKMSATMNLHNLFGFLRERCHSHAQYEIRVYADAMLDLIEPIVPVSVGIFKESLER